MEFWELNFLLESSENFDVNESFEVVDIMGVNEVDESQVEYGIVVNYFEFNEVVIIDFIVYDFEVYDFRVYIVIEESLIELNDLYEFFDVVFIMELFIEGFKILEFSELLFNEFISDVLSSDLLSELFEMEFSGSF